LYKLGGINEHSILFREVQGDSEDVEVPRSDDHIHLVEDEHFYSAHEVTVIVNGKAKMVTQHRLAFDQVVALAFSQVPSGANILFTITYRNGPPRNPSGSLLEGQTVRIQDQMIFNVTSTDKS
ncbi:MAG: multiubiquitin domain-containing protein, partial [Alphaproteobacteria bacterium]